MQQRKSSLQEYQRYDWLGKKDRARACRLSPDRAQDQSADGRVPIEKPVDLKEIGGRNSIRTTKKRSIGVSRLREAKGGKVMSVSWRWWTIRLMQADQNLEKRCICWGKGKFPAQKAQRKKSAVTGSVAERALPWFSKAFEKRTGRSKRKGGVGRNHTLSAAGEPRRQKKNTKESECGN